MLKHGLLFFCFVYLGGCATVKLPPFEEKTATSTPILVVPPPPKPIVASPPIKTTPLETLFAQYNEWKGTRYRMGSLSKTGIDCSGFVMLTFRNKFGIKLPRSTQEQHRLGQEVKRNELLPGDLVFFHTGRYDHVGIYLQNGKFLHASTRVGVKISHLSENYWHKHFWKAKRLSLQPGK